MPLRSYHQYCGLAKALDVVGSRWTLLIVRNLLLGPLRYTDLLRGLPGITTNLLAGRLKEMEAAGLIESGRRANTDAGHTYRLTPRGADLEPAVHALGRWGWGRMGTPSKGDLRSLDFLMVALRRRYLGGVTLAAQVMADGAPYRLILSERSAEITRGDCDAPDLTIHGPSAAIMQLFLDPAVRKKLPAGVRLEGSADALRRLLDGFAPSEDESALPPPRMRRGRGE
jgi:DNA-binding HxlR family transcriptional regulator